MSKQSCLMDARSHKEKGGCWWFLVFLVLDIVIQFYLVIAFFVPVMSFHMLITCTPNEYIQIVKLLVRFTCWLKGVFWNVHKMFTHIFSLCVFIFEATGFFFDLSHYNIHYIFHQIPRSLPFHNIFSPHTALYS